MEVFDPLPPIRPKGVPVLRNGHPIKVTVVCQHPGERQFYCQRQTKPWEDDRYFRVCLECYVHIPMSSNLAAAFLQDGGEFAHVSTTDFHELTGKAQQIHEHRQLATDYYTAWTQWQTQYMHSQLWALRREGVILAADGSCMACGCPTDHFEVHHVSYWHIGAEPLWDLKAVCSGCHQEIHRYDKLFGILLEETANI